MSAPILTRILSVLFAVAAVLMAVSTPLPTSAVSDPQAARMVTTLFAIGVFLTAIYGGAAWAIWRRKSWSLAMLLSVLAFFGWAVGTALSVLALILLTRRAVKRTFADQAGKE